MRFGHHVFWGWGWGSGWGIVMLIGMVLFWAVVIYLIVWAVRGFGWSHAHSPSQSPGHVPLQAHGETPLDILKRRYAAGEIDKAEFDQKKSDLTG